MIGKLNKNILIVIGFVIFTILATWGLYILYRKLVKPSDCPKGKTRYPEYNNECLASCEGEERCPITNNDGSIEIVCVEKCSPDKLYNAKYCNSRDGTAGYCELSCLDGETSVLTMTDGQQCGTYCTNAQEDPGFPSNYCKSKDSYCGITIQSNNPTPNTKEQCLSNDLYTPCPTSSIGSFYCAKNENCVLDPKNERGYICEEQKCTSTSTCNKDNPCTSGTNKCQDISSDRAYLGYCEAGETIKNNNCCPWNQIGENEDGSSYCCITGSAGIQYNSKYQCPSRLHTDSGGNSLPCCINGLCPNGWQCIGVDQTGSTDVSTCLSSDTPIPSLTNSTTPIPVCCGADKQYNLGNTKTCCPQKPVPSGPLGTPMCLNVTTSPIDSDWVEFPESCKSDNDCLGSLTSTGVYSKQKAVSDKMNTIQWTDDSLNTYGKIFCDTTESAGVCRLGCGYREDVLGQSPTPYKTINVTNSTGQQISRCYQETMAKDVDIVGTSIRILNNNISPGITDQPTLLCTNKNDNVGVPYWNGSKLPSSIVPDYNVTYMYDIDSPDPFLCPVALHDHSVKKMNATVGKSDGNSLLIKNSVTGKANTTGTSECIAEVDCNVASSFFYNPTGTDKYNQGREVPWYKSGETNTYNNPIIPTNIGNMKHRVSKLMEVSCANSGANTRQECDSLGTVPSSFLDSQVTGPCYWNTTQAMCLQKTIFNTIQDTKDVNNNTDNLTCNNSDINRTNCLPQLLSSGRFCENGTNDGINCMGQTMV
jgi:hypothetical protein